MSLAPPPPMDRFCAEIGQDPATITRSIVLPLAYDQPAVTRGAVGRAIDAGFRHIILSLPAPYPADVARRVTGEAITASV